MYSILLVEDEIVELDALKNYVDWSGCGIDKVYTARGARGAMSILAEYEPDIMITDIQMPKITGIELSQMIREEGYHIKIVFLTGYDKFEYVRQAVQLHAEDFLLKPFQGPESELLSIKDKVDPIEKFTLLHENSDLLTKPFLVFCDCLLPDKGIAVGSRLDLCTVNNQLKGPPDLSMDAWQDMFSRDFSKTVGNLRHLATAPKGEFFSKIINRFRRREDSNGLICRF